MKKWIAIAFTVVAVSGVMAQRSITDRIYSEFLYKRAFERLNCMLNDTCKASFKEAVFLVENAYMNEELDKDVFDNQIAFLADLVKAVTKSRNLVYEGEDKTQVEIYAALFSVLCDSLPIQFGDSIVYHPPYTYDFYDIWGHGEWSNMFVSKLLQTHTGNCHSLPYLYKIIAEELESDAHLAIAPNHFYIKHYSKANGWYNTELTSAAFPIDAWLMASGYIHLDAVVNRLYMEALTDKQALAVCMTDLAKGYQRKVGIGDGQFMLKCTDAALAVYPNYINALLLKTEVLKKQLFRLMEQQGVEYPSQVFHLPEAKQLFDDMETLAAKIHTLGYRKMPEEMYVDWLVSLNEQREKYTNKKISTFK